MTFVIEQDLIFFQKFFTKGTPRDYAPDNNPVLFRVPHGIEDNCFVYKGIKFPGARETVEDAILKGSAIYAVGEELFLTTVNWLKKQNIQRLNRGQSPIFFYISGYIDGIQNQTPYLSWFEKTATVYKKALPLDELDQLIAGKKPYVFNALLGRVKPHRTILHQMLASENGITTLIPDSGKSDLSTYENQPNAFIWEGDYSQLKSKEQTVETIKFNGYNVSISKIIPTGVYAKSRWCVVAETNFDRGHVFITEKTVKPIIAKKPFVIAGNPGTLRFLRNIGFKTFSPWINESYDEEPDFKIRILLMVIEILKLCNKSESELNDLDKRLERIVEHNRNHLYSRNWTDVFYNDVYPKLP